jgi:hypothetical protein
MFQVRDKNSISLVFQDRFHLWGMFSRSTKDMSKKFCPSCGYPTLIRTSITIDEYGEIQYHLKKNFQYRLRGTIVSNIYDDIIDHEPTSDCDYLYYVVSYSYTRRR